LLISEQIHAFGPLGPTAICSRAADGCGESNVTLPHLALGALV